MQLRHKSLVIISAVGTTGLLILFVSAEWAAFAGLTIVALSAMILGRKALLHPYLWYTAVFYLYSVSHPVLVWVGENAPTGSIRDTLVLEWLALSTFVLVVGPGEPRAGTFRPLSRSSRTAAWLILAGSLIPCSLLVSGVQSSSLKNSVQIVATSNLLPSYHWGFSILILAYAILLSDSIVRKRRLWGPAVLVIVGIGSSVLSLLIIGQRSDIFRALWITLLLIYIFKPGFRRIRLAILAFALLCAVPIAQELKSSLISGRGASLAPESNLLVRVLKGEFVSASENLSLVIARWGDTRYYGQTLVWDLVAAVRPSFLFPDRKTESVTNQFNIQMFQSVFASGGGQGFTLIGEGYVNFGAAGVVLWFMLVGLFVRFFYQRSGRSLLAMIAYVMATPLLMISTRGDMSNIMSQFGKHVLLPLILVAIVGRMFQRQGCVRRVGTLWELRCRDPQAVEPNGTTRSSSKSV